ncbi:BatD family protein [Candidatus Kapabacteria bacterium]|nr:BatD family protein [Candidatus Kapabacteria bacterium]
MKNILIIILLTSQLFAQNFNTTISKNPVTQGENFRVVFTLNAQGSGFKAPKFSGFTVVGGPSQSTSTQIINGKMSMEQSWTYVLRADKVGNYFIAPANISVDGKNVRSNRLKVKVSEPSQAEKERRQQAQKQEQNLQNQADKVISENLYMKIKISRNSAYIGEQILATYELYANDNLNIINLELKDIPNFNGFWTSEFDREAKWENTSVYGVRFRKAVIKQVLLYPQQSGELTLDPMRWNAIVRLRTPGASQKRRSVFDNFFDRGSYKDFNYTVSSGIRKIKIKDLPDPKPLSFYGGVGQYELESWLDKTELKTGETLNLKVKLSGAGNMKLLSTPEIDLPTGFELFEPKMVDNSKSTTAGTSGNIIFEYLMIPRNEGEFKIPPLEYSYFNPSSKKYETLKTQEFQVSVSKGDGSLSQTVITGVNKENLQYLGKDIRFIKTETNLQKNGFQFFASIYYWALILLGIFLFILIIIYKRKTESDLNNQDLLKTRKAKKIARKRLAESKKYLDSNDKDKFIEEIIKVLWNYVSDKLTIAVSDLSKDSIATKLNQKGVNIKTSNEIIELIEICEFSRYAPSDSENDPQNIFNRSSDLITKIEEELK